MLIPRYLATFPMLMNSSFILITINIITCIYGFYWVILMLLRPPLSKAAKRKAIRAASADGSILAFAASGARLCEQARRRQDLWPTAAAATGRVLVATALLALPLKAHRSP